MTRQKKIIITLVCLVIVGVGLWIRPSNFEFHKERERTDLVEIPDSIKAMVLKDAYSKSPISIARHCAKVTCGLLDFSFNQDVLFEKPVSKAHCVNYAKVCAALCNVVYDHYNIDAEAIQVVGRVTIDGVDIHKVLTSIVPKKHKHKFINHDMVEIRSDGKTLWFIDPVEREIFGLERVYLSNNYNLGNDEVD